MIKLLLIAGARPNFMKIAPIIRSLKLKAESSKIEDSSQKLKANSNPQTRLPLQGTSGQVTTVRSLGATGQAQQVQIEYKLVHTGQHYDYEMSQAFFEDLDIPKPDYFLNVGSGSHAEQTAKTMVEFEKVCEKEKPHIVIVVGDVNSTLACSIVAKKFNIKVAHVEAGLRSFDLTMPEEINRMVTDAITDYFFVTEQSAIENLKREGKPEERIYFVGHVMIDNLLYQLKKIENAGCVSSNYQRLKQELGQYAFLTLHRPSNVDSKETLTGIVEALNLISKKIPIVFPVHPRTAKMLKYFRCKLSERVHQTPPLRYQDALFLWKDAKLVMTDSGGLQEETTALGIPCLTLRDNTERPITCEIGTNRLVGNRPSKIIRGFEEVINGGKIKGKVPPMWDGKAAERIVDILLQVIE